MSRPRFVSRRIRARSSLLVFALVIAAVGYAQVDRFVDEEIGYRLVVPQGWALHQDPAGLGVELTYGDEATVDAALTDVHAGAIDAILASVALRRP